MELTEFAVAAGIRWGMLGMDTNTVYWHIAKHIDLESSFKLNNLSRGTSVRLHRCQSLMAVLKFCSRLHICCTVAGSVIC